MNNFLLCESRCRWALVIAGFSVDLATYFRSDFERAVLSLCKLVIAGFLIILCYYFSLMSLRLEHPLLFILLKMY